MTTQRLGRRARVDFRDHWEPEAGDFTPWQAQAESIEIPGLAIGMELEVKARPKSVGPFRADILCRDTADGHWVLVENQLQRTDRTHFGQLLTYAARLNAVMVGEKIRLRPVSRHRVMYVIRRLAEVTVARHGIGLFCDVRRHRADGRRTGSCLWLTGLAIALPGVAPRLRR